MAYSLGFFAIELLGQWLAFDKYNEGTHTNCEGAVSYVHPS